MSDPLHAVPTPPAAAFDRRPMQRAVGTTVAPMLPTAAVPGAVSGGSNTLAPLCSHDGDSSLGGSSPGSNDGNSMRIAAPVLTDGTSGTRPSSTVPPASSDAGQGLPGGLELPAMDVDFEDQSLVNSQFTSFELRNSTGRLGTAVHDHLYVGSVKDAGNKEDCDALGIRAFLCVAEEITSPVPSHVSYEDLRTGELVFEHLRLTDDDCTHIRDHIPAVFDFIDRNANEGRPVLIYCQQGKSRSVSFAVAYMMRERGLSADAALAALRQRYKRAEPNMAFLLQLKALEAGLIAEGERRREEGIGFPCPPTRTNQPTATVTARVGGLREADAHAFFSKQFPEPRGH